MTRILNEATGQELSFKKEGAPAVSSFQAQGRSTEGFDCWLGGQNGDAKTQIS